MNVKQEIYKAISPYLNKFLDSTISVNTAIFSTVDLNVEFRRIEKNDIQLHFYQKVFAYLEKDKNIITFIFYYENKQDKEKLIKQIQKNDIYIAYSYFLEIMKTIHGFNTYSYYRYIKTTVNTINPKYLYALINAAASIYIFNLYKISFKKIGKLKKAENFIFYDDPKDYKFQDMLTIITKLASFIDEKDIYLINKDEGYADYINQSYLQLADQPIKEYEYKITTLGEHLLQNVKPCLAGSATASIFEKLIEEQQVNSNWIDTLKKKLKKEVYYKTSNIESTWSKQNILYRNVFKAPSVKHFDNFINVIVSIDQSGSIRNEELGEFLHILKKLSKKVKNIVILIHDTEINKIFNLYEVTSDKIVKACSKRYLSGGTSHNKVFEHITDNYSKKELKNLIYLSFSDNYSDISESYKKHKKMKHVSSYFICTINNPVSLPNVKNIIIERRKT